METITHQHRETPPSDEGYQPGELRFLVEGNSCRLLDGRRTPGRIEAYDPRSAMFTWRITAFEDEGKSWEVPAEEIRRFQFPEQVQKFTDPVYREIQERVAALNKFLNLSPEPEEKARTEQALRQETEAVSGWLEKHSKFFSEQDSLDWEALTGPASLCDDMDVFMKEQGLIDLERETSRKMVLNPHWWEWIKGMKIVLAEMGLAPYAGKIPRKADIFKGAGRKQLRRTYLVKRLGFLRAVFQKSGCSEIVLYRGMSAESGWKEHRPRTFVSFTFSEKVARDFADLSRQSRFKHAYILKRTFPVQSLLMTYLETAAMNAQYQEAEAIILGDEADAYIW